MKTTIITVIVIIQIALNPSHSQTLCPAGNTNWNSGTATIDMGQYGPGGSVNFDYREENGEIQIKMDWTNTFQNTSDFIPNSALKKILENKAVEYAVNNSSAMEGDAYVYFLTDCNAKVKIAIKLDMQIQEQCCDEGANIPGGIQSRIENGQTIYYYNIYKYVKCGEKCCARKYHWKKVWDNFAQKLITIVYNPTAVTITDCTSISNYTDCITGEPIPCESGDCDQW